MGKVWAQDRVGKVYLEVRQWVVSNGDGSEIGYQLIFSKISPQGLGFSNIRPQRLRVFKIDPHGSGVSKFSKQH